MICDEGCDRSFNGNTQSGLGLGLILVGGVGVYGERIIVRVAPSFAAASLPPAPFSPARVRRRAIHRPGVDDGEGKGEETPPFDFCWFNQRKRWKYFS